MNNLRLQIPESIHQQIKAISEKECVSVDQFIFSALSEKISAYMYSKDYIKKRAEKGSRDKFLKALDKVPATKAETRDEF